MVARSTGTLVFETKRLFEDGHILDMRVTAVPTPVLGSRHLFKYRLFYDRPGVRLILFDNERGKGDHRHYRDREESYAFVSLETLFTDFLSDVAGHIASEEGGLT